MDKEVAELRTGSDKYYDYTRKTAKMKNIVGETKMGEKTAKVQTYILLHLILLIYSLGEICSKYAGQAELFSQRFFLFYGLVLLDLVVYALMWQQILKKLPLITAYANKAIIIIWGLVFGMLFFKETITVQKIIGAVIIMAGVVMVVKADED